MADQTSTTSTTQSTAAPVSDLDAMFRICQTLDALSTDADRARVIAFVSDRYRVTSRR